MGMALLRRLKGKGGKAGGRLAPGMEGPLAEAPMPMLPPPEPRASHKTHHAGGPVVHIHIGPSAAGPEAETPEEELPESPADEAAEPPPPLLLRALHDKVQAARRAGRK